MILLKEMRDQESEMAYIFSHSIFPPFPPYYIFTPFDRLLCLFDRVS